MTHRRHPDHARRTAARREGIALTPRGEPLFRRDWPRWVELGEQAGPGRAECEEMDRIFGAEVQS